MPIIMVPGARPKKILSHADRLAQWTTMAILDVGQHRAMFVDAGFTDVSVDEESGRGWICVMGTKA